MNSGQAAFIILANTLAAKLYMSVVWRGKLLKAKPDDAKKIRDGEDFKNDSTSQLNEAEYAPLFIAVFLFLFSKGITATNASMLASFGCPFYVWSRIFIKGRIAALGAVARYASLAMLCVELYKLAF
jgi:hypothetical protein